MYALTQQEQAEQRVRVQLPAWSRMLDQACRYKVAYGGRGSSKSWTYARKLLLRTVARPLRVLCTRELQVSIKDSVHRLLSDQIVAMGLSQYFDVNKSEITCNVTGSEFLFKGLRHNASEIKSIEGVDICWIEEASGVSHESLQLLIPTVRTPGSEIWVTFNPDLETDPTYQRFVVSPPPSALVQSVNFRDNPWFPDVLNEERLYLLTTDLDAYMHVWEGKARKRNKAAILEEKCVVDRFNVSDTWAGPYYGIDWGFGSDPFACVTLYVDDDNNRLYVRRETWALKLELNLTAPRVRKEHPGIERYVVRADNARPESISHVSHTPVGEALPRIVSADKWPGSVEDGIEYLRTFDAIVIHEECTHMQQEAHDYTYAVDTRTGDILPKIVDKHNHLWDAIRYALAPRIRQRKTNTTYAGTPR